MPAPARDRNPGDRVLRFGHHEGMKLKDVSTKELESLRRWCDKKDKEADTKRFKDLIDDIEAVLSDREGGELFEDQD